jgi:hypothetical protein
VLAFVAHAICQNEEKKNFSPRARAFVVHVICLDEEKKNPRFAFRVRAFVALFICQSGRKKKSALRVSLRTSSVKPRKFVFSRFSPLARAFAVQTLLSE